MNPARRDTRKAILVLSLAAVFLAAGFLSSCAGKTAPVEEMPQPVAADSAVDAPLIPREVLFGNPERAAVRLSPDGKYISFLAPLDGVLNVWVGDADAPDEAKAVTGDTSRGIRSYFWAYTGKQIIYLQDEEGDENWRVYSVDVETVRVKNLTPVSGVRAEIKAVSHNFPEEIIVGLNDRDQRYHDLYRVNIVTGERTLIQRNDRFAGFLIDDDYEIRAAVELTPDGGTSYLTPNGDDWEPFIEVAMEDSLTTGPIFFDPNSEVLYLYDSRGRDTSALVAWDLATDEKKVLASDPRANISGLIAHPSTYKLEAASFTYARRQWVILDPAIEPVIERLEEIARGDFQIASRTQDDTKWIVAYERDDGPIAYYLFHRDTGEAKYLFTNRKALEGLPLARMHPVVIRSRDGLNLVSYLTLPLGSDPDGDGVPDRPVPMVLDVHGGPWARVNWGYDAWAQWLSNRGYAVLAVNFRGSTGFGKEFINAANFEWGAKMHDDLIDAVDWAIEEGVADADRVAIAGGSYGGYAALAGVTFTPEKFACAVDIVGPSNLITLLESIPPYWKPIMSVFTSRVGNIETEEGRAFLKSRSPLTFADRIERPLLIGQGANDPRVKQAESDQIVAAMQENGIPVTYVLYPDEGHGFARPENRLSFFAVMDQFLAKYLGGRAEPIGDDFTGSTIEVREGANLIPGLESAIPASK